MNKLKRFTAVVAIFCIFSVSTYAETKDVSFKATISTDNVTIDETSITGNIDNSNLQVQVIKKVNEQFVVIYTGRLGDYENGMWNDVDFNAIQKLAIINYDALFGNAEHEVIYITPVKTQQESTQTLMQPNQNTYTAENTFLLQNEITTQTIQTNTALMYNDKYYENVLLPGQILTIPVTVTNTGDTSVEIVPYIAKYDLSGRLIDLAQGNLITAPANQTVTATLSSEFDADITCTAKVFLWQKDNIKPVAGNIYLTISTQDYYADTYTEANKIDIDKHICGVINTSTDIDIVKFTPNVTGFYALQLDASSGTACGLYDSTQTLLNSVSAVTDKNYLLYSLTANQDYYIRFNGAENNSYEITPTLPSELTTLAKNIGTASSLSESYDYNVYKFTPTTTGSYIITAVDSSNVKADLYNVSFEKVASSDVSDTSVSFRITNEMTANQAYYVVVYPKSETSLGTYTMYVEEPFALISVE